MTTAANFRAALAANPRDLSLWLLTAHLARLTWWRLRLEDERKHGMVECSAFESVPTFALLFDREGPICTECAAGCSDFTCHCKCHKHIPGHVTQLADYLASQGDTERAEAVRGIEVVDAVSRRGLDGKAWAVREPSPTGGSRTYNWHDNYPDACREAIRRICAVFTEMCDCAKEVRPKPYALKGCPDCFGLGWRASPPFVEPKASQVRLPPSEVRLCRDCGHFGDVETFQALGGGEACPGCQGQNVSADWPFTPLSEP
jgi:hypothetical protein